MPQSISPKEPNFVDLEQVPFRFSDQDISDVEAIETVKKTFTTYAYGSTRTDRKLKWDKCERLYAGTVEQRTWPGTDVKRAAISVPIAFDQVETAFPIIADALFGYEPFFFDVTPVGGTQPVEAAKVREVLAAYLDTPFDESGMSAIPYLELALRQFLKLGDGVVEVGWDTARGGAFIDFVDIRHLYFDSNLPVPLIDRASSVVRVKHLTVQELVAMTNLKLPPEPVLNWMAKTKPITPGEESVRDAAVLREDTMEIGVLKPEPRNQTIEVLEYWSQDRLIWVLNRVWCAQNGPNPYGFIPFCKAPFVAVEGRPYGLSAPELLENEQKYAQGITSARIDNLSLGLVPPRIRKQGKANFPSQTSWRPGLEDEVSNPKEDVQVQVIQDYTKDAYREVQLIEARAAKRLGINDFAQSGVPTPSNANRSAFGVSQQAGKVSMRLRSAVKNFENYLIVPMLYKTKAILERFAPEEMSLTSPVSGQPFRATKTEISKRVRFKMKGASRMIAREKLMMLFQPLSQALFNDVVTRQANVQGKTLDFNEWERFFQDATQTAEGYKFFRAMTPQEQQRAQQPPPEVLARMQEKQLEAKTRIQMGQLKSKTEVQTTKMKTGAQLTETGEKSARDILKILKDNNADRRAKEESSSSE